MILAIIILALFNIGQYLSAVVDLRVDEATLRLYQRRAAVLGTRTLVASLMLNVLIGVAKRLPVVPWLVTVKVPPRPDLNYLDLVALARQRAGVSGDYRVSGWSFPSRSTCTATSVRSIGTDLPS